MNMILIAVISVTIIGIICAMVLSVASKVMHVEVDARIAAIMEALPGTNCGACGYPGCSGYADALISGNDVKDTLCTPGGSAAVHSLSVILGLEEKELDKKQAVIHCRGDCNVAQKKMDYKGIQTCAAAKLLSGGDGACAYGCLGYGDCLPACPYDAICLEDGLARINPTLCIGCGLCVSSCPNKLITIDHASEAAVIMCNSLDKGAVARKKCSYACIGCKKCARECPSAAIAVENNLAKIDYEKCVNCAHCAETCVTHSIQALCLQPVKKDVKAG